PSDRRRLSARALAADRSSVGVPARRGEPVAQAPLRPRADRRNLGCPTALDALGRRGEPRDRGQRRSARVPRAVHPADGARLAEIRCTVRALLRDQPRDPAQLPELALAVALVAPVRARRLPVLPRARRHRPTPTRAHCDPRLQLALPRHRGRAVGAVAVGGVKAASLDAVTIDAYGTLLTVVDPVSSLGKLLPAHDPA